MGSFFLPYGRQTVTAADIAAVEQVLHSPWLTQGPVVPAFEQALAEAVDVPHVVATNSATSGLHLACLALGLGPGDWLWTTPITFVASANCGRYCGARVDFVDIDPATGLMSLQALARKLEKAATSRNLPKVIIPVHLAGSSCAMEELAALVKPFGIAIVEDASHAVGARYQDQPVGNCRFSDVAVFSFHPVKIITTGEGGAVTTRDPALAARMARLRSHGITKDPEQFELEPAGPWSYEQQELGFNYRLTDMQAALGLSQLQRLEAIVEERNRLYQHYQALLKPLSVNLLKIPEGCISALHLAVIRMVGDNPSQHRRVFEGLRAAGVGVQLHYTPVHLQPDYRRLGFGPGDFPESEVYARSAMSLPLYPGLKKEEQEKVVEVLAALLKA